MTSDNIEELNILTYDGLRMRVGKTSDQELERIIRAGGRRGEIYARLKALRDKYADLIRTRYPNIPRRVSGYGLDSLLPENEFHVARALVGTEGTCVTVLEATTHLVYSPPARSLLVLGYPNAYNAADHVPEILAYKPIGLEGFDNHLVENIHGPHRSSVGMGHVRHLPGDDLRCRYRLPGSPHLQALQRATHRERHQSRRVGQIHGRLPRTHRRRQ